MHTLDTHEADVAFAPEPPITLTPAASSAPHPSSRILAPAPGDVLSSNKAAASAAALASAALAACGGGGASDPGASPPPPPAPPAGPTPETAQAARFLLQAQFSASDAEIAAVQAQGYSAWLDAQLSVPSTITGWDWMMAQGYNTVAAVNSTTPCDHMIWKQLIGSSDAVRKRVALALSEFFVVSVSSLPINSRSFAMAQYWDVLSAGALGNFRALLEEITLNPAMGVYLNTRGNKKTNGTGSAPDENYAREVLQLFSIGLYELNLDGTNKLDAKGLPIETYDQATVTSLANVFTGYNFDATGSTAITNPLQIKNRMVVTNSLHEYKAVTFLGKTIAANTEPLTALNQALDIIFNHTNVGPFLGKQLIQRLVTSNPSPAYVARVATVFNNNGNGQRGDLKAVVKAILLDTEARDANKIAQPTWGKQSEPMLRFVQWARTFGGTSTTDQWVVGDLSDAATRLGQSPLRSGSVFNFFRPGYVPPNTALATQGLTAPEFQLTNESTVAGYLNFALNFIRNGVGAASGGIVPPPYTAELALASDSVALVNRLNLLLCAGQLSAVSQATISTAVATINVTTATGPLTRVQAAVLLTMACPEYLVQK
jgi:uncharacterized protein (DUF1800 family)